MAFAIQVMAQGRGWGFNEERFLKMLDIEPDEENETQVADAITKTIAASPERALLISAYCAYDDSLGNFCKGKEFKADENINFIYSFLQKLGYAMSDQEQALCNGVHELFICDIKEAA